MILNTLDGVGGFPVDSGGGAEPPARWQIVHSSGRLGADVNSQAAGGRSAGLPVGLASDRIQRRRPEANYGEAGAVRLNNPTSAALPRT